MKNPGFYMKGKVDKMYASYLKNIANIGLLRIPRYPFQKWSTSALSRGSEGTCSPSPGFGPSVCPQQEISQTGQR